MTEVHTIEVPDGDDRASKGRVLRQCFSCFLQTLVYLHGRAVLAAAAEECQLPQSTGSQPPSHPPPGSLAPSRSPEHAQPFERLENTTDVRSWIALLVMLAVLGAAAWRWEWIRWPLGVVLVLAVLRAVGFVFAAKSLGKDPETEEKREKERKADGPA